MKSFDGVGFAKDIKGHYIWVNDAFVANHGYDFPDFVIGKKDSHKSLPWSKLAEHIMDNDKSVLSKEKSQVFKETSYRKSGLHSQNMLQRMIELIEEYM